MAVHDDDQGPRRRARADLGAFLTARRARVALEDAGLPTGVGRRRVPGLRREEVALLAGISVEYYARMERGDVGEVSPPVVEGLCRALALDAVEREHLDALLRTAAGRPPEESSDTQTVSAHLLRLLHLLEPAAAFLRNGRLDILAANPTAHALYAAALDTDRPNLARYVFCDDRSRSSYADWPSIADQAVGTLRSELGQRPHDRGLLMLVRELAGVSEAFRDRWEAHDVRRYRAGQQGFVLPDGSVIDLDYQALTVVGRTDLTLLVYSAAPGSDASERLAALTRAAGWA